MTSLVIRKYYIYEYIYTSIIGDPKIPCIRSAGVYIVFIFLYFYASKAGTVT